MHMSGEQEPPIGLLMREMTDKIFRRGRGGCCLELKGLFALWLRELGYNVLLVPCWVYAGAEGGNAPGRSKFRTVTSVVRVRTALAEDVQRLYLVDVCGWEGADHRGGNEERRRLESARAMG